MSAFGEKERVRQAAFRASSKTVSTAARKPCDDLGRKYDYYLALGCEEENLMPAIRNSAGAVKFFADRKIKWWRGGRSGDRKGMNIPTRNMASSQIACVNFLMPLAEEAAALTAMIRCIDADITAVVPLCYSADEKPVESFVEFEWIGLETSLEYGPYTRGANSTSADALVVGTTSSGINRAYVLEWKYVEEYKAGHSLSIGPAGAKRRGRYSEMFKASDSPFKDSSFENWFYEPLYQVMRQLLLSRKMIREKEFGISEARVVVVCPKGNTSFRDKVTSADMSSSYPGCDLETAVREQLVSPNLFTVLDAEDLFVAITQSVQSSSVDEWSSYNSDRYGFSKLN